MSSWLAVIPEIAFVVAVLAVPGFVIGLCLRFGRWDAMGLSIPLGLGNLAVADQISSWSGIAWGLPVIAGTAAGLALVCFGVYRLLDRYAAPSEQPADVVAVEGAVWDHRHYVIALLATLGAAVVGTIAIARGMGTPEALNQTYDGAYHVTSTAYIAQRHFAGPSVFSQLGDPAATGGFYPPSFSAIAALLVMYFGLNPVVAANATAVAIAFMWPLCASIGLRRLARPTAFGYAVAMVGAVTVGLFPALLIERTVWPNALGMLTIGPALVLVMRLLGVDRARDGADDPQGRLVWRSCAIALLILLPGMTFAHPSALFGTLYLAIPLAVWRAWRRFVAPSSDLRHKVRVSAVLTASVFALLAVVISASYQVSSIRTVARFPWPAVEPWWDAFIQVFALTSRQSHANLAFGLLTAIGIWVGVKHARGRFLITCYVIVAALCSFAAGVQSTATKFLTGYWYNDVARLFAVVPVVALPLAAIGADAVRVRLLAFFHGDIGRRWVGQRITAGIASALVVCVGILVLQAGLGTARISRTVFTNYRYEHGLLISPGEDAMFRRLTTELAPGKTIAGNPFTGEILVGVISAGPQPIYPKFGAPSDPIRALVALKFREYQSNPVVCAAVKSLAIDIVVTGRIYKSQTPADHARYVGFDNMATIPGLTKIDSGGGATAYRVGPCNSAPYIMGPLLTQGQEQMFKDIASQVPPGTTIAGSPYEGEIFAAINEGQTVLYERFGAPTGRDEVLVARRFRDLYTDPAVCAAVERLKISVVVTGDIYPGVTRAEKASYAGFENLGTVPGLTVIGSGDGATAYSVNPCSQGVTP